MIALGAGLAVLTGIGAGIGIGVATSKASEEASGDINKVLLLGCALAEATAIYGFVVAVLIIFFLK